MDQNCGKELIFYYFNNIPRIKEEGIIGKEDVHMKKILICILVLILGLAILYKCKKQTLPVPQYPLDSDTIVAALQEWGLSYTIEEDDWVRKERQGQSLYNLYSAENGEFVAGISSSQKDGERLLFISFPPFYFTNPISVKEYENAIAFATLLYGGFQDQQQVYKKFTREYDRKNTEKKQYEVSSRSLTPTREGESRWERKIGATTCQITLEQPTLSEPEEYLKVIMFVSDWDTFYSE